jgi:transcription elongation factor GreA
MAPEPVYVTEEGLQKFKAELEHLRTVRRQEVAARIQQARELEVSGTDAEYDDAKNEQAFIEGRILELENIIKNAAIVQHGRPAGRVGLGSTVKVVAEDGGEETYTIVGSTEADPVHGKISNESPVGKALLGKKMGDTITVAAPRGSIKFKIKSVK